MRRIFLLLLVLIPTLARAQDRLGTRLNWETVEVLIFPTPSLGMQLQVNTSAHSGLRRTHGLTGGYAPDSVFEWLNAAALVLKPTEPPSAPTSVLVTPPLRSATGDSVRLMRRAKGTKWDRKIAVLVDVPGRQDRFDILAKSYEIQALLDGLLREAGLSGFVPESVATIHSDTSLVEAVDISADPPVLLTPGPLRYPDHRHQGRVVMAFIIGRDGTPEPASIRAVYSEQAVLADWARDVVAQSRFIPGKVHGRPIRVWVQQAINYIP